MEITPIPSFLVPFLWLDEDGILFDNDDFSYLFHYINPDQKVNDPIEQRKIVVEFYRIAKEMLDLRLVSDDPRKEDLISGRKDFVYPVPEEKEIWAFVNKGLDRFNFTLGFDIPMYWYDEKSDQIGKSIMPQGIRINFWNFGSFTIILSIEFNLFTQHLRLRKDVPEKYTVFPYFEPAAKLNREIFRNFAKAVVQKFPGMVSDFSSELSTVPEHDEYGYPDGAEDFYYFHRDKIEGGY
jgi:hypothetical protein